MKMKAKKSGFKIKMKHHMIQVLLNAMSEFQDDETMMRNGCLTLCQFNMPEDVVCCSFRLKFFSYMLLISTS